VILSLPPFQEQGIGRFRIVNVNASSGESFREQGLTIDLKISIQNQGVRSHFHKFSSIDKPNMGYFGKSLNRKSFGNVSTIIR
jgi:hypothetical protein